MSIKTVDRNRSILPPSLTGAYDSLKAGLIQRNEIIDLPDPNEQVMDNIKLIWMCVLLDNPQIFWTGRNYSTIALEDHVEVEPHYSIGFGESLKYAELLIAEVSKVDAVVKVTSDIPSIVLSIHDYLASKIIYDQTDESMCHNIIGALVNNRAVCDGISSAASLMIGYAGIECETLFGKIRNNNNAWHAWNRLGYGGKYLHLDITNDLKMSRKIISHKYFLIDEQKAHKVLSWMGPVGEPSKFDYYSCTCSKIDSILEMNSIMAEYATQGICSAELSVSPDLASDQLLDSVFAAYLPVFGDVSISYTRDELLNIFSYDVSKN